MMGGREEGVVVHDAAAAAAKALKYVMRSLTSLSLRMTVRPTILSLYKV